MKTTVNNSRDANWFLLTLTGLGIQTGMDEQ